MHTATKTVLGALALSFAALAAQAQTGPAATPGIDQRQANQDQRIDQGIASGQLTRRETRRMERQQAAVNRAEDKAKADGTVTARERKHLSTMQDHASRSIYRQKHDAQKKPRAAATPAA